MAIDSAVASPSNLNFLISSFTKVIITHVGPYSGVTPKYSPNLYPNPSATYV